ncbi:MAG: hypothetical protein AAFU78_16190, partial [Cyanobacteria bacterium J06633_2]
MNDRPRNVSARMLIESPVAFGMAIASGLIFGVTENVATASEVQSVADIMLSNRMTASDGLVPGASAVA